jgi:murein DD-endopeptidase MepM/ murein hydrolase activator NlpD
MTVRGKFRHFQNLNKPKLGVAWALFAFCLNPSFSAAIETPAPASNETSLSARSAVDGSIVLAQVVLPPGVDAKTLSGKYLEFNLDFYPCPERGENIYEAIVPIPFNHAAEETSVKIQYEKSGSAQAISLPLMITAGLYKSETLNHLNPEKVNKQTKKDLIRIQAEQKILDEIYARVTPEKYWKGPFSLPLESQITSPFGTKRVYNGEMKSFHKGLDFRATVGTPIHAASAGEVVLAQNLFFSGNTVILDHGYGLFTFYFHMSKLGVKKGSHVKQGEVLGLSGATGRVTGPHLHWQAAIHHEKFNPLWTTTVLR